MKWEHKITVQQHGIGQFIGSIELKDERGNLSWNKAWGTTKYEVLEELVYLIEQEDNRQLYMGS